MEALSLRFGSRGSLASKLAQCWASLIFLEHVTCAERWQSLIGQDDQVLDAPSGLPQHGFDSAQSAINHLIRFGPAEAEGWSKSEDVALRHSAGNDLVLFE